MLHVRVVSPATLTGQLADRLAAAPEVGDGQRLRALREYRDQGGAG
jgi:hypothetical protein